MQMKGQAQKVTVYLGESDRWKKKPLYMAILEMLKAEDCAGATVTRAVAGFGAHSRIHTASLVDLSSDLPLVIEWVDNPARIERVMPKLLAMVNEGLITVETIEVIKYAHRGLRALPANIPVQDIMSREVRAVQPDTSLLEIMELLLDKTYRALPVVDADRRVVGIVTEADLLGQVKTLAASAKKELTQAELAADLQRIRRLDQSVAKAMTPNPVTVTGQTTVAQAVRLMTQHNIKRLPVVDADEKLIGIISRVDVLRALYQPPLTEMPRQQPAPGERVRVEEIMMTNIPTVPANAPLAEIVGLLVGSAQRRVIVLDDNSRVAGIITDGDLINRATPAERTGLIQALSRHLLPQPDEAFRLSQRTASQVMTSPVITVLPQTQLPEALQLLLTHQIKRLPVVNEQGQLVGLVGRGGILRAIAQEPGLNVPKP